MYTLLTRCARLAVPATASFAVFALSTVAATSARAQGTAPSTSGVVDPSFTPADIGAGGLDDDFNPAGSVQAILPQADGKLLVVGSQIRGIVRLNADGTKDTTFNVGSGTDGTISALIQQTDGSVVIGGEFTQVNGASAPRLVRLNGDGSLDASYAPQVNGAVRALTMLSTGQVAVGGEFTTLNSAPANALARLNGDGSPDGSFNAAMGAAGTVYSIAENPDGSGRLLVGGDFTSLGGTALSNIGQVNADGSADSTFDPDPLSGTDSVTSGLQPSSSNAKGADGVVRVVRFLPDGSGRAMIGGAFTHVGSAAQTGLVRVTPGGKVDAGFNLGSSTSSRRTDAANGTVANGVSGGMATVYSLDFQDDGKLVVGGGFTQVAGVSRNNLVRVYNDGSVDSKYNSGSGANASVRAVATRKDGKSHVAGSFDAISGQSRGGVARLTADTGTTEFFEGQTQLPNSTYYYLQLPNGNPFGYYNVEGSTYSFPYMFHNDLGFEYVFDAGDNHAGVYLYDFASSTFFYTSPSFPFPYLYDFTLNTVLYYYPDPNNVGHYNTNGVRFFYDFANGQIITK